MDILRRIWKFVDYNRYFCAAVLVSVAAGLYGWGCQSTTTSPITGEPTTRPQLNTEIERFNIEQTATVAQFEADIAARVSEFNTAQEARLASAEVGAEAAFVDLDRQDEIRAGIINVGQELVGPMLGPYAGTVGALLAITLGGDNIRKRATIKRLKNGS